MVSSKMVRLKQHGVFKDGEVKTTWCLQRWCEVKTACGVFKDGVRLKQHVVSSKMVRG